MSLDHYCGCGRVFGTWADATNHSDKCEMKADRDRLFNLTKMFADALRGIRHFQISDTPGVTYNFSITGDKLALAKKALAEYEDLICMCGHQGPDRQGYHIGAEIPAPSKRLACTHPGCNCKGFGTLKASVDFIMDTRFGGS